MRVSQGTITLLTYAEGAPDPNPSFPLLQPGKPRGTTQTGIGEKKTWRTLEIENEYLKCTVLPDLGGRVYSCIDKISGHDLFYANAVIKKHDNAKGGGRAAAGNEFNFQVSPVDYASRENSDGSASIFVGATDRLESVRWLVEIVLKPGSGILEERVTLSNPSPIRRRYSWWNRAEVPSFGDTRVYLPCYLKTPDGFAARCQEAFIGVYSAREGSGTAHYADPTTVTGKKAAMWSPEDSKNLTDDGSLAVEIQAGLFADQQIFDFLEPGQARRFTEYWMPLRGLGGLSRVTPDAAVSLARSPGEIKLALNVYRKLPGAKIRVFESDKVLLDEKLTLDPAKTISRSIPDPKPISRAHFELLDNQGKILLAHTEDYYDALTAAPPAPPSTTQTASEKAREAELQGDLLLAARTYEGGLAAGRVLVALNRFDDAILELSSTPPLPETHLYLGFAFAYSGDDRKARSELTLASDDRLFGLPGRLELAKVLARSGDRAGALREVEHVLQLRPDLAGAGSLEVALLRRLDQTDQAKKRLAHWLTADPTDLFLRHERVKLGGADEGLWRLLAGDPDRVLDLAAAYMSAGMYDDAVELLDRKYADPGPLEREPGSVLPQDHPLVSYYRGYCRTKLGTSGRDDFLLASKRSAAYVFPNRPESLTVLRAALKDNASDATAHYLLGCWYVAAGMAQPAAREWQDALKLHDDFPSLRENLGILAKVPREVKRVPQMEAAKANPNVPKPTNPEDAASIALKLLESGRINDAAALFTEANFPKEKQSDLVREAFIEVRLQAILEFARRKRCAEALPAIGLIGDEIQSVPFSMYGFGNVLKSVRIQYMLAGVESMCGDEKAAKRRYGRIAKTSVYAALASAKIDTESKVRLEQALDKIRASQDGSPAERLYWQGLLERELGNKSEADAHFQEALGQAGENVMLKYLAQMGLREK